MEGAGMPGLRTALILFVAGCCLQGCANKPLAQARVLEVWEAGRPAYLPGYTKGSIHVYHQTTLYTDGTFEMRQTTAAGMATTTTQRLGEWSTDPQTDERILMVEGEEVGRLKQAEPQKPDSDVPAIYQGYSPPQRVYAVPNPLVHDPPFSWDPRLSE